MLLCVIKFNKRKKYMSTNKQKVAVIGLGNIGKIVAANLVRGNREVIIAAHKIEDARALSSQLGSLTTPADVKTAIQDADIIVLSVWFSTIQEFFKEFATELKGKIVIDPSNPIAPDGNGGFKKIIAADESAGQILKALLPRGATLVKAFGSLAAATLSGEAFQNPAKVLFYASDDGGAHNVIEALIKDSGFEPVFIGTIDHSIKMEVFGELHEFGALGKAVTLAELQQTV
jgi:predicted dinucleotide-binding enzyme